MAASHKVILTDSALSQLREIAQYILPDSPQNAQQVAEAIITAVDSMGEMPARFKRVAISRKHKTPIHAASASGFIIYFKLDSQKRTVHVLAILRGAHRQPRSFD